MNKSTIGPIRIGVIGAGAIVTSCHLPAYAQSGYHVAAIYDRDPARAQAAAAQFGIPRVCATVDEMLADSSITIVDIAVPPVFQPPIAHAAIAAGKHLLCQKPLAWTLEDATALVEAAERAGVKLAVNQQMRWDPMVRETRRLMKDGVLGQVLTVTLDESVLTDWFQWPWIPSGEYLDLMLHSIHYFDSFRYLFGEPEWVFSTIAKYPGQPEAGETRSFSLFQFPGELIVSNNVRHKNWSGDEFVTWRVEGTTGMIRGRFGHLDNYPHGGPDQMEYIRFGASQWTPVAIHDKWFPDAFAGPMGSLIQAVEQGGDPETNGRDNLRTLAMVWSCYRSSRERRAIGELGAI